MCQEKAWAVYTPISCDRFAFCLYIIGVGVTGVSYLSIETHTQNKRSGEILSLLVISLLSSQRITVVTTFCGGMSRESLMPFNAGQ